jgi:transcriptional regulator with XRE-family HTH domain
MRDGIATPAVEAFGRQLVEARSRKGLSQRALAARVGMTQAHISKIEQGRTDLRLSSLIELARALDLDVQLIPRHALAVIESVLRVSEASPPTLPAFHLDEDDDGA